MHTPCRMSSQLSMQFSSYFTFVYLALFHYFIFQTLGAVSTNVFILTMHHDNNRLIDVRKINKYIAKLNFAEIV